MSTMPIRDYGSRLYALWDGAFATLIAVISLARGQLLFFSERPKTPLRILCIVAFDTLRQLRGGKQLSALEIKTLATLLDFAASANAAFDHKKSRPDEYRLTLKWLQDAGFGQPLADYIQRLTTLEEQRPLTAGDSSHFQKVAIYRESVVRLSLGIVATTVFAPQTLEQSIDATHNDSDLDLLFRIVMQCQIIDDVLDYSQDWSACLPSFLTASQSLPLSLTLTQQSVQHYANSRPMNWAPKLFPFRVALFQVSFFTLLLVTFRRWKALAQD